MSESKGLGRKRQEKFQWNLIFLPSSKDRAWLGAISILRKIALDFYFPVDTLQFFLFPLFSFKTQNLNPPKKMTKKNFIDLADAIRVFGENISLPADKISIPVSVLADFCATQNPNFDRNRWLDYIAGNCGKNGGKVAKK